MTRHLFFSQNWLTSTSFLGRFSPFASVCVGVGVCERERGRERDLCDWKRLTLRLVINMHTLYVLGIGIWHAHSDVTGLPEWHKDHSCHYRSHRHSVPFVKTGPLGCLPRLQPYFAWVVTKTVTSATAAMLKSEGVINTMDRIMKESKDSLTWAQVSGISYAQTREQTLPRRLQRYSRNIRFSLPPEYTRRKLTKPGKVDCLSSSNTAWLPARCNNGQHLSFTVVLVEPELLLTIRRARNLAPTIPFSHLCKWHDGKAS